MRRLTGFLGASVALGTVSLVQASPAAGGSPPAGGSQLMVLSTPPRAEVFIDGEMKGVTPLTLMSIGRGAHEIKVVLDGYETWTKKVNLKPGGNSYRAVLREAGGDTPAPRSSSGPSRAESGAGRGDAGPVREGAPAGREAAAAGADTGKAGKAGEAGREDKAGGKEEGIPRVIQVPCPRCRGEGVIKETGCRGCEGDGYAGSDICTVCSRTGRAELRCPYCYGGGKLFTGGRQVDCRACAGKGHVLCPGCKGTGEVARRNPEAAPYPTVPCDGCEGEGYEKRERCNRCGGDGKCTVTGDGYYRVTACRLCGGDGEGAKRCSACGGRGYRGPTGPNRAYVPCMVCCGTGHLFLPCRTCGGRGWYRAR